MGAVTGDVAKCFASLCVLLVSQGVAAQPQPAAQAPRPLELWVDADDDDGNLRADRDDQKLPYGIGDERLALSAGVISLPAGSGALRLWSAGTAQGGGKAQGGKLRASAKQPVLVQGVRAGVAQLLIDGQPARVDVLQAYRVSAGRWVEPPFASVSRVASPLSSPATASDHPTEALRLGVRAGRGGLPASLHLLSYTASGRLLDQLGPLELKGVPCPAPEPELECGVSAELRLLSTATDRDHPSRGAALRVSLAGRVEIRTEPQVSERRAGVELHVVGPSLDADPESLVRRVGVAQLRVHVMRQAAGGSPAIGGGDAAAERLMRREVADTSDLWAQCGVQLEISSLDVVDPLRTQLLAVGCEQPAAAAGGALELKVAGRQLSVSWGPGLTPREVTQQIRAGIEQLGFRVAVRGNGRNAFAALEGFDLLVTDKQGHAAPLQPVSAQGRDQRVATDPALSICIGAVNLTDGLSHFNDFNASSGTVEERTLLSALEDSDPATIELVVVPSFVQSPISASSGGRIGESFIYTGGSALRNALIVDRAGIRAGSRSFVLAHELGHILLDQPGHPDDFGVDDPGRLMDSDAAEASVFGPRRLIRDECRRLWAQSGPSAPLPLVREVPSGLPGTLTVLSPPGNDK